MDKWLDELMSLCFMSFKQTQMSSVNLTHIFIITIGWMAFIVRSTKVYIMKQMDRFNFERL